MVQQIRAQHHCRRVSEVGSLYSDWWLTVCHSGYPGIGHRYPSRALTFPHYTPPRHILKNLSNTVLAHCHGEFRLSPGRNQGVGPTPISSVLWRLPLTAFKVSCGRGSGFMAGGSAGKEARCSKRPETSHGFMPESCSATQLFVPSQSETSFFDQSSHLLGQAHPA